MTITARHYRDLNDFENMQALLVAGQQADTCAYYVHPGDLGRWLFHTEEDARDRICLWEWNSRLAGLSLLSTTHRSFDVFVQPEYQGRALEAKILLWAEVAQAQTLKDMNNSHIRTKWVAETDLSRINWLKVRGFKPKSQGMLLMQRSLIGEIESASLPAGYNIRHVDGLQDARSRALTAHAAFDSDQTVEEYQSRITRFMDSTVYDPQNDILVEYSSGEIASFGLLWPDLTTHVGLSDPVGTHPNHRRLGLAKAVMTTGLKRLKDLGMTHANVYVETDNLPAIQLYDRLGYKRMNRLLTFEKPLI